MRMRRMDLGLLQREAASEIGVSEETLRNWEMGWRTPAKRYGPAIKAFLGSSPQPSSDSLPDRLRFIRWTLGLTQEDFAFRFAVNRCTISSWEAGRHWPNQTHRQLIDAILTSASGRHGDSGGAESE